MATTVYRNRFTLSSAGWLWCASTVVSVLMVVTAGWQHGWSLWLSGVAVTTAIALMLSARLWRRASRLEAEGAALEAVNPLLDAQVWTAILATMAAGAVLRL